MPSVKKKKLLSLQNHYILRSAKNLKQNKIGPQFSPLRTVQILASTFMRRPHSLNGAEPGKQQWTDFLFYFRCVWCRTNEISVIWFDLIWFLRTSPCARTAVSFGWRFTARTKCIVRNAQRRIATAPTIVEYCAYYIITTHVGLAQIDSAAHHIAGRQWIKFDIIIIIYYSYVLSTRHTFI